jgi:hypothetical protein
LTVDAAAVAAAETVTQAVDCVDLSYQFATRLAVDNVNLSIAPGCTSLGEQVALPRDELLDGLRGSAGDFLDRGGNAVIPILAM